MYGNRKNPRQANTASFGQYSAWHSRYDVASPVADWLNNEFFNYGVKKSIYKRAYSDRAITKFVLSAPVLVSTTEDGETTPSIITRDADRIMELVAASVELTEFNATVSMNMTLRSSDSAKRGDWSDMNVEYWSADGYMNEDVAHDEIKELIAACINHSEIASYQGMCSMMMDEYSYWGTLKIWTGEEGYGNLGNCECNSADYDGVQDSECDGQCDDVNWCD